MRREGKDKADALFVTARYDRTDYIRELGLPDSATWGDIGRAQTERYRLVLAHHYDLPDFASFEDILKAQAHAMRY